VQEEIFGPVCTIAKFKTEEDAISAGNATTYGLAAAVHTSNLNTAIRVSNELEAGYMSSHLPRSSNRLTSCKVCMGKPIQHGRFLLLFLGC
jgi:hypothetical protein